MNYYERHLGDYARDAGHLSLAEHGAYTLLLDRYYATEAPIPADQAYRLLRARTDEERAAVDAVLSEFFTLTDAGWAHGKCDREIAKYQERQGKARASANARWAGCERNANAMRTQCDGNAHQTPDTSNQSKAKAKGDKSPLVLPDWLPADAWQDWHTYRNGRRGWTAKARELSLRTLTELWATGENPRAVINQSIERGWTGLFPTRNPRAGPVQQPSKTLTAIQNLEAMKHGLAANRTTDGLPEIALLGTGTHPGD